MGKLGKEKCFDIYKGNKEKIFLLGNEGREKLFVVGLNPSTANQSESDETIDNVKRIVALKGFDGFVMTNLYPLRCSKPEKLPRSPDKHLVAENLDMVFSFVEKEGSPVFWAAWGGAIEKRCYFTCTLEKFVARAAGIGV